MYFITKNGPTFWPLGLNPSKSQEHLYGRFHKPLVLIIHQWTLLSSSCSSEVTLIIWGSIFCDGIWSDLAHHFNSNPMEIYFIIKCLYSKSMSSCFAFYRTSSRSWTSRHISRINSRSWTPPWSGCNAPDDDRW